MGNNCQELFEEYKKLEASTHIEAQILGRGELYKVNYIKPEELTRRKEVAKELASVCKDLFKDKPAEWFDIQRDI